MSVCGGDRAALIRCRWRGYDARALAVHSDKLTARAHRRASQTKDKTMKKLFTVLLSILFVSSLALATQTRTPPRKTTTGGRRKEGSAGRFSCQQGSGQASTGDS